MIVSNVKDPISTISIECKKLGKVTQYDYLGMTIHEKLSMDVQIESICIRKQTKNLVLCLEYRGLL